MTKDLTTGSPYAQILSFAFPLCLGMLFQQFYNVVDTVLVGRLLGVRQLAGVGCTGSLNFMVIGFCVGVCAGFAIPVAREFGAGRESQLRRYTAGSGFLALVFSAVLTSAVAFSCRQILTAMNTPADIIDYADAYIFVIFLGIPFTFLYNLLASILRALGDSRSPVIFLAISSFVNILLDLFFVAGLGMGVEGTALATVISQAFSGLICLVYMAKRYPILHMSAEELRPSPRHLGELCMMGIPMGLQYSVTAIGTLIVQRAMNALGSAAVAGAASAQRIHGFLACPLEALGAAMAPYTAQNLGAGKIGRIGQGTRAACVMGFIASGILYLPVLFSADTLAGLFLNESDSAVVDYACRYLSFTAGFYCLLTIVNAVRFSIQGMGFSALAIVSGIMELAARAVVGLVLAPRFGFTGLCFAHPLAWLFADLFLIPAFFLCKKQVSHRYSSL